MSAPSPTHSGDLLASCFVLRNVSRWEEISSLEFRGKCRVGSAVLDDVTSVDAFLQFRGGPGTHETALGLGVNATQTAFGQSLRLFAFHAASTKGKREFAATTIG